MSEWFSNYQDYFWWMILGIGVVKLYAFTIWLISGAPLRDDWPHDGRN